MNDDLHPAMPPEEEPPDAAAVPEEPEVAPPAFLAQDWEGLAEEEEPPESEAYYYAPVEEPVAAVPAARRSRTWLWAVPVALLVAACAYLVVQNRAAAATVETLTTRVPQLLLPTGTQNPLAAQLSSVSQDAGSWNFLRAQKKAASIELPLGLQGQMPGLGPRGPAETGPAPGATPQAEAFFMEHPDLNQRFTMYADQARALRDQGQDVQPLRDVRTQIFNAATQGDVRQVTSLLDQFAQGLRQLGGNPEAGDMQQVVGDFQKAFEKAQKENRDPRAAVALMHQAEAAVQAGKRAEAVEIARKALAALQRAPRVSGGGTGRRPGGLGGPAPGQPEQVLQATFQMLDQEERDLAATHQAVDQALSAQLQDNPAKVREVLATARESLIRIHDRRAEFSVRLAGKQPPQESSPPGGEGPGTGLGPRPQLGPLKVPEEALEQFSQLIDTARGLTPEEYHSIRLVIARRMIGMILGEPGPGEGWRNLPPQERIRQKLRAAQEPYMLRREYGEDISALTDLLREAREDLAANRLIAAEKKADAVLRELGLLPKEKPPTAPLPPPLTLERQPQPLLPLVLPKEQPAPTPPAPAEENPEAEGG